MNLSVKILDKEFPVIQFLLLTDSRDILRIKGQLISKCPYEMIVSSKIPPKLFLNFCPGIFVPSWGLPGIFLKLPVGFLVYDISYLVPKSFQEALRKLQKNSGQISKNNFVGILDETIIS